MSNLKCFFYVGWESVRVHSRVCNDLSAWILFVSMFCYCQGFYVEVAIFFFLRIVNLADYFFLKSRI